MYLNPYEVSELEGKDLICTCCGNIISTEEYIENDGFCNDCC